MDSIERELADVMERLAKFPSWYKDAEADSLRRELATSVSAAIMRAIDQRIAAYIAASVIKTWVDESGKIQLAPLKPDAGFYKEFQVSSPTPADPAPVQSQDAAASVGDSASSMDHGGGPFDVNGIEGPNAVGDLCEATDTFSVCQFWSQTVDRCSNPGPYGGAPCAVCGKPSTVSGLVDPFGKSDKMVSHCQEHATQACVATQGIDWQSRALAAESDNKRLREALALIGLSPYADEGASYAVSIVRAALSADKEQS